MPWQETLCFGEGNIESSGIVLGCEIMSKKVVINSDYGGFGLSDIAISLLEKSGCYAIDGIRRINEYYDNSHTRDSELLVKVVDELGEAANSHFSKLQIKEVPDEYDFVIDNYDGLEKIRLVPNREAIRKMTSVDEVIRYLDDGNIFLKKND